MEERPVRKRMGLRDLALVAIHLALLPVAALVPARHWPGFCRLATRPFGPLATPAMRARREVMVRALAGHPQLPSAAQIDREALARRLEQILHHLRARLPRGSRPRLRLRGAEQIDRALAAGRGAVLWIGPQVHAALGVKTALFEAGYAVHHLSSPHHGISRTHFGKRFLNPLQVGVESRLLAERIVNGEGDGLRAARTLAKRLDENRIVSISCIPIGSRLIACKMLSGRMYFAPGAAALALSADAPLLPVFCAASGPGALDVTVGPALEAPEGLRGRGAVEALVAGYAARVEAETLRDPASSLVWQNLL